MNTFITLKRCRSLKVLDFVKNGLTPISELISVIQNIPEQDKQYSAAIGLAYALVIDDSQCKEKDLIYLIQTSKVTGCSDWSFNPAEFGVTDQEITSLLEYTMINDTRNSKLKVLVTETDSFKHLQYLLTKVSLSDSRIKEILLPFTPLVDFNELFTTSDENMFNICEPNLILHYFLDNPQIIDFLITNCGASIEATNAIGFDFITYCIMKNKYNLIHNQIKKTYTSEKLMDFNKLITACTYIYKGQLQQDARQPQNISFKQEPKQYLTWRLFVDIQNILKKYYQKSDDHPLIPYVLERIQNLTLHISDTKQKKYMQACLIQPLFNYFNKSKSINYRTFQLVKKVVLENIHHNPYIDDKKLKGLLDIIQGYNIYGVDLDVIAKYSKPPQENTTYEPTCAKKNASLLQ